MPNNPVADIAMVETVGQLRRERRALDEVQLIALGAVVKPRHSLEWHTDANCCHWRG
jgi:hypothetical protein